MRLAIRRIYPQDIERTDIDADGAAFVRDAGRRQTRSHLPRLQHFHERQGSARRAFHHQPDLRDLRRQSRHLFSLRAEHGLWDQAAGHRILIACVGNIFLGDDGFGAAVASAGATPASGGRERG
jgi:hypothetical protein